MDFEVLCFASEHAACCLSRTRKQESDGRVLLDVKKGVGGREGGGGQRKRYNHRLSEQRAAELHS